MIVGFTCGSYDLLHAGHVHSLEWCRDRCDRLLVGLHTDPTLDRPEKNKPVQTVFERYMQLRACKFVDEIIPYDTERDLENLIATVHMEKRFVGQDHYSQPVTGSRIMEALGIELLWVPRYHSYSSSGLRERISG